MALEVIALGTGTCSDTMQTKQSRQPPGFLICMDGQYVLLDCSEGIRFRIQALGIDLAEIRHVFVSHAHPDHAALPQFIQAKYCRMLFGGGQQAELRLLLPEKYARDFMNVWNWHQPENDGGFWKEFAPQIGGMRDGQSEELFPDVTLTAFDVYHGFGRHPAMGCRIVTPYGIIAYTGDSGVCDGVQKLAEKADILIIDCSTRVGQEYSGGYGHMGPRQCGEIALKAGVKQLWLTHYFDIDDPQTMLSEVREAGFFGETRVTKDGDRAILS